MKAPLLRLATPSDAERLSALHGQCFAEAWETAFFAKLLSETGGVGVLASETAGGPPCGFAIARIAADEAELISLGIAPTARRRKIGLTVLGAVSEACRERGARELFLEVADDNHAAQELYRRAGFLEIGRRAGYYVDAKTGVRVDALQLSRKLGAAADD